MSSTLFPEAFARVTLSDTSALNLHVNTDANGIGLDQVNLTRISAQEDIGILAGIKKEIKEFESLFA